MLHAEEATNPALPFMVALGMLVILFVPMIVNEVRKRRGEARFHHPLTITFMAILVFAGFAVLVFTILDGRPWKIVLGFGSLIAFWAGLIVMLSRGKPTPTVPVPGEDVASRTALPEPHPDTTRLAVAAQVAGILSLVVSVIALVAS